MLVFGGGQEPEAGYSYLGRAGWNEKVAPHLELLHDPLYRCGAGFYPFMSTSITSLKTQAVLVRRRALDRYDAPFE
jgi:hypothetical protein